MTVCSWWRQVHSGTSYSDAILWSERASPSTRLQIYGESESATPTPTAPLGTATNWLRAGRQSRYRPEGAAGDQRIHNLIRDVIDGRCDLGGSFMAAYKSAEEAG